MHKAARSGVALWAILAIASIGAPSPAPAAGQPSILGLWKTGPKNGEIRIEPCGDAVCGRIITSPALQSHPDARDARNPDPGLRARSLKGLRIIDHLKRDGEGWSGGAIYNPWDGRTYQASVVLDGPDRLKLKGCVVFPICQTQTWTRLPADPAG